jgi:hypothetical protein
MMANPLIIAAILAFAASLTSANAQASERLVLRRSRSGQY